MISSGGMEGSSLLGRRWRLEWDWVADWRAERSLVEVLDVLEAGRRERWEEKRLRRTEVMAALVTGGLVVGCGAITVGAGGETMSWARVGLQAVGPVGALGELVVADSTFLRSKYLDPQSLFALATDDYGYLLQESELKNLKCSPQPHRLSINASQDFDWV